MRSGINRFLKKNKQAGQWRAVSAVAWVWLVVLGFCSGPGCGKGKVQKLADSASLVVEMRSELQEGKAGKLMVVDAPSTSALEPATERELASVAKESGDNLAPHVSPTTAPPVAMPPRYKTDVDYLALRRFEFPDAPIGQIPDQSHPPSAVSRGNEDTAPFRSKRLILGGKGTSVSDFEAVSKELMTFGFSRPSAIPSLPPESVEPEKKKDSVIEAKPGDGRRGHLVFHERATGLANPESKFKQEIFEPAPEATTSPSPGPRAKINFSREGDRLLPPRKDKKGMDLIFGDPEINRDRHREER
jgi:hypothetical protein